MNKLTANKEQLLKLKDGLKRGGFDVDIFPVIGSMFKEKKEQYKSLVELSNKYKLEDGEIDFVDLTEFETYEIELNRDLKICILECLHTCIFNLSKALPTIKRESERKYFYANVAASDY